jgi:hypothetical protein
LLRVLLFALSLLAATQSALGGTGTAVFTSTCSFSHMANDDPIVWPGRPGYSHNHTFVGNVSTNAFSTVRRLRAAGASCSPSADSAAYWAPTLYADGHPVVPSSVTAYYRRLTAAPVRPFPPGLRMVAGDARATAPQSTRVTFWTCALVKTTFYAPNGRAPVLSRDFGAASSSIPDCTAHPPSLLALQVNFPECWDGKRLDSHNHRSHMSYASAGACPPSHPVALPALSLVYHYPANLLAHAAELILSSGGQYSGHADFINSWDERVLRTLVATCLNAGAYCAGG